MEVLRFIWRRRYKKTVFTGRTVSQRALFIRKAVRRDRFCSDTQRAVAERTISIRRTVVEEHGFNTEGGGVEDGSNTKGDGGEDGSNTEGGGVEDGSNTKGGGGEDGSNTEGGGGENGSGDCIIRRQWPESR